MLGKQNVMFKIMRNEMFIIFYILRLAATLTLTSCIKLKNLHWKQEFWRTSQIVAEDLATLFTAPANDYTHVLASYSV